MNQDTAARLRNFIERVENVQEERKALTKDIADILAQAKGEGFDPKVMRQVLRLRKLSAAERDETDMLVACPKGPEEVRSGTWSTVRFARKRGKRIVIIMPDGTVTEENP